MKINYIHQHFRFPEESGGGRPWEFARRLSARGHAVTVFCGAEEPYDVKREGVRVIAIRVPYANTMGKVARFRSFASFMLKATMAACRVKADVIYASSTPLTVAVPGRIAACVRRVPYVFEVRDVWPEVPVRLGIIRNPLVIGVARGLERWAYRGAREIVALSPGMAADIRKVDADSPITVIPNASDIPLFDLPIEERRSFRSQNGWGSPVVSYVGSLGASYDPEWLARLALELDKRDVRLLAIGRGSGREQARSIVERGGLSPDEVFPGSRPKLDIAAVVASSDICVSSLLDNESLEVNSLNKVFDAYAAGRPVVLNHGGWLTDITVDAGAGQRVSRDPVAAASQIRELCDNRQLLHRSSLASRKLADRFDRDVQFESLMEVLRRVVPDG